MNYQMTAAAAEDVAERGFQCATFVFDFMKNRWENSLKHIEPQNLKETLLIGLWQRSYSWLRSLSKLNGTSDFQAIATASRALLEIYVDMGSTCIPIKPAKMQISFTGGKNQNK